MAVQAQYPSNVLLPDFRNRRGQDLRNVLLVGFGSDSQMHSEPNQPSHIFNAVPNSVHGQQNGAMFHLPEDPPSRKRPREAVDLIALQHQRPLLINLCDLHQQAPAAGPGNVPHSVGTVSTGLRLAFEDEQVNASRPSATRGDAASTLHFLTEDIASQLQKQKEELDQFVRAQADQLRQSLEEKRQRHSQSMLSMIEESVLRKIREKDLEMEKVNLRNRELEEQVKQLKLEACIWQSKAKHQEAMVKSLRKSLQQAVVQGREQSKEGCGDSEADDAESSHIDPNVEAHRARSLRGSKNTRDQRTCKVCQKNSVSILLLPCRHLCLCRECDNAVDSCPLCYSMKNASVEVYMS